MTSPRPTKQQLLDRIAAGFAGAAILALVQNALDDPENNNTSMHLLRLPDGWLRIKVDFCVMCGASLEHVAGALVCHDEHLQAEIFCDACVNQNLEDDPNADSTKLEFTVNTNVN